MHAGNSFRWGIASKVDAGFARETTGGCAMRMRVAAVTGAMLVAFIVLLCGTASAATFANTGPITLPDANCTDPDAAVPYPANIVVSGLTGTISDVNVTLTGVTHAFEGDIEMLLVGPAGQNLTVLSDAGTGSLSNATVNFDDEAASLPPQNSAWGPGTYRPVNYTELGGPDVFPAPAPTPSSATALSTFDGTAPNGTWSLYITDDACPDAGTISGGWSLEITAASAAATMTSVVSTPSQATTGSSIATTATVTQGGSPVTSGTVTFTEGLTPLAANVALNASGQASFTTSAFAEGDHTITATYNGTASFGTSNATTSVRLDNATTVSGTTYCNTGPVGVNDNGTATPYPSNIFVSGLAGGVGKVTVQLKNVSHTFDGDIEVLLAGPTSANNVVLVSDAGTAAISNLTVAFDDAAAGLLPASGAWAPANSSITVKPTDYNELAPDSFPAPAPSPSGVTTLAAAFNGTNPNGTWKLFVKDDGAPDSGSFAGGWCITVTPAPVDLSMSLKGSPNPVSAGSQLTYQLRMRNVGSGTATGMKGVLTLSPSQTFVSATSACTHSAGVVTCTIPRAISPGAGATPSVVVTANQPGVISATATVSSNVTDAVSVNDSSTERTRVLP